MYSLCCSVLSALSLLVLCTAAFADADSDEQETMTFVRWTGSVHQSSLADGSILSEYVARTESDNARSASLQVTFIPRFGCSPLISVQFSPADLIAEASSSDFLLSIDAETMPFPMLIDEEDDQVRLSLNADSHGHQRIRQILDNSSRATLAWPSTDEAASSANSTSPHSARQANTGAVNFSLLGSRRAVAALESRCRAHVPIAYEN